jgi:hypothetical protein
MPGILYGEESGWVFLALTVVIGGGTAYLAGRAVAKAWRPAWMLGFYMGLLAGAVRFLHFALFEGTFFSLVSPERNALALRALVLDFVVLLVAALVGWRITRTNQMTTQYRWLYEKTSPFSWRRRVGTQ